jgi:Ca2+-binding EF-hand superfamily protein
MLQISSTERDLLYTIFKELDFYDRNEVYLRAFLKKFKLRPSPFTTKLFELFDTDKSGAVDFKEFVVTVCKYNNTLHFHASSTNTNRWFTKGTCALSQKMV